MQSHRRILYFWASPGTCSPLPCSDAIAVGLLQAPQRPDGHQHSDVVRVPFLLSTATGNIQSTRQSKASGKKYYRYTFVRENSASIASSPEDTVFFLALPCSKWGGNQRAFSRNPLARGTAPAATGVTSRIWDTVLKDLPPWLYIHTYIHRTLKNASREYLWN